RDWSSDVCSSDLREASLDLAYVAPGALRVQVTNEAFGYVDAEDAACGSHELREREGSVPGAAAHVQQPRSRPESRSLPGGRGLCRPHLVLKAQSSELGVVGAEHVLTLANLRFGRRGGYGVLVMHHVIRW